MNTITLDGIEYEAAPEVIKALEKAQARIDEMTKAADASKANLDSVTEQLNQFKARNLDAEISAAVQKRIALETTARGIVKEDQRDKLAGMTDADVKKAVIMAVFPEAKLDAASPEYIQARFDIAVETGAKAGDGDASADQRAAAMARKDAASGGAACSMEEKRKQYMDRLQNQYKDGCGKEGKK